MAPLATILLLALQASSTHIRVDQLGYRPLSQKVAILREPKIGFDAPAPFAPGTSVQIRRASDHTTALTAPVAAWNGGATHSQSGDRVWWADFSSLTETGSFYLLDPASGVASETFEISHGVYDPILRQALRMFFYQRCGAPKASPFAEAKWADAACHTHSQQDTDCRLVTNPTPATSRDLSGGWHDAGDYNKYVNFADDAIHALLTAYEARPRGWSDSNGIPESGNGIPDILDEVKWELDWMLRMRNADGSVLHKVSVVDFSAASPPSADTAPRRYAPATASATISACGAFAHAALVFGSLGDAASQAYSATLRAAAVSAWSWLQANAGLIPSFYNNAGFQNAAAEDSPYDQTANRVRAAAYLFALTSDPAIRSWFDANYQQLHLFQWQYALVYEHGYHEALLSYTTCFGATSSVVSQIRSVYAASVSSNDHLGKFLTGSDAYRAHLSDADHTWGSNRTKAQQGCLFAAMNRFGLDVANARRYLDAAEGYLHYLHGVNPPGFCYLTNLASIGAARSVQETYHAWFADGTAWDNATTSSKGPAPGFLTGGPNPSFAPDPSYGGTISPPQGQPVQKSYKDWNTSWPQNSWEITECQLAYQAAYVQLLSEFSVGEPNLLGLAAVNVKANANATFTVGGAAPGSEVAMLLDIQPGGFSLAGPTWCVELGIPLTLGPNAHLLHFANANAAGTTSVSFVFPSATVGYTLYLQAAQGGTCPWPTQSAVIPAPIQP